MKAMFLDKGIRPWELDLLTYNDFCQFEDMFQEQIHQAKQPKVSHG